MSGNRRRQRDEEALGVERFLASAKLSLRVEAHRDGPDFILKNGDDRVGLEHVYAGDGALRRSQSIAERYVEGPLREVLRQRDAKGLEPIVSTEPGKRT